MDDITPKDPAETSALSLAKRIGSALGIVIASASALLAAFGGMQWITDHLPLLGTGLASLVGGAATAYVAVHRMRADKIAKSGASALCLLASGLILGGCALTWTRTPIMSESQGETVVSDAVTLKLGIGTKDATASDRFKLSADGGLDISGQNESTDTATSFIQGMKLGTSIGEKYLQLQGIPVPASPAIDESQPGATVTASADRVKAPSTIKKTATAKAGAASQASSEVAYSTDGYGGSPGATGEGVYGRPSCARCRAYHTAHPDAQIINLDDAANRTAMWAALRRLGFTGAVAALPVAVTADAYTLSAK